MNNKEPTEGRRSGSTVGPYVLHEEIGRGGMGVVYRATRADNGLEVAIKLMLPELTSNTRFRERFIAEAQTAPKLDHPNIVPVYEAGEVDSELYIAMRLVHGPDLKQVIEREGGLAPQRVAAILRQASAALDYAHGTGVVHRDVKPQNILMSSPDESPADHVYITDFGLVKPVGSESTASRTSEVLGSIQYMAPEQIEGMPTDGRADVYSLGCVAFEALTGSIPFDRANEVAVLWAHVHEDPPRVTDIRPDLAGGLDIAVANALAKHPDDRHLTCGEFTEALEQGLSKSTRPITMPLVRPLVKRIPRKKTEREVWAPNFFPELSRVRKLTNKTNWARVAAVTLAVSLVSSGLVEFAHPQGLAGAAEDVADVADSIVTAVTDLGSGPEVASSDLGRDHRSRQGSSQTPGEAPSGDRSRRGPTRRDGSQRAAMGPPAVNDEIVPIMEIVFVADDGNDSEIYKTDPDDAGAMRLTDNETQESYPSWSPDGKMIAFSSTGPGSVTELWVMRSDGSGQRRVLALGGDESSNPSEFPDASWSPDGKRIVYSFKGIYVVNVDGSGKKLLANELSQSPDWSPNGDKIAVSREISNTSRALWIMNPDGSEPQQLTNPSEATGGLADRDPTWTADGTQIAFSRGTLNAFYGSRNVSTTGIFLINADGTNLHRVTEGRGEYQPSSAGSGDQYVYVGPTNVYGEGDLYLIDSDGSNKRQLTTDHRYASPDWRWPAS